MKLFEGSTVSRRIRVAAAAVALGVLTAAVFYPVTGYDFVNYDEFGQIIENPLIRSLSPASLARMFQVFCIASYYPVRLVSLAVDYHFWQLNAGGYHLTNLVIHGLNVLLLFALLLRIVRRSTGGGGASGQGTTKHANNTKKEASSPFRAFRVFRSCPNCDLPLPPNSLQPTAYSLSCCALAAALFAVHPLVVEPVAWIQCREELLMTFFTLACVYVWLGGRGPARYALALFFAVCACLCNVMAVVIPALLMAADWILKQRVRTPVASAGEFSGKVSGVGCRVSESIVGASLATPAELGVPRASQAKPLREEQPNVGINTRHPTLDTLPPNSLQSSACSLLPVLPFWVLSVATLWLKSIGQGGKMVLAPPGELPDLFGRIAVVLRVYAFNLRLLVWPDDLSPIYPNISVGHELDGHLIAGAVCVAGTVALLVWLWRESCPLAQRVRTPVATAGKTHHEGIHGGTTSVSSAVRKDRGGGAPAPGNGSGKVSGVGCRVSESEPPVGASLATSAELGAPRASQAKTLREEQSNTGIGVAIGIDSASDTRHSTPDTENRAAFPRMALFGLVWFLVCLAPSSQILVRHIMQSNRFLYLPLAGLVCAVAAGLGRATASGRVGVLVSGVGSRVSEPPVGASLAMPVELGVPRASQAKPLREEQSHVRIDTRHPTPDTLPSIRLQPTAYSLLLLFLLLVVLACAVRSRLQLPAWKDSISLFSHVLEIFPRSMTAHHNLASTLALKGDTDGALRHYQLALTAVPDDPDIHANIGLILMRQGKVQEAIDRHLLPALKVNPRHYKARMNLTVARMEQGDIAAAQSECLRALEISPASAEAHQNMAAILAKLGRNEQALAEFHRVLEIDPDYADAHNALGAMYLGAGKLADALAHLETAVRLRPDMAKAHNNLGAALMQAGKPQEALDHFRKAIALQPGYVQARGNEKMALEAVGRSSGR